MFRFQALEELDLVPWQPPEVIKQNRFSPASDVHAFAVLFWEVLHDCRNRPFNCDSSKEVAIKVCDGKRPLIPKESPQWAETLIGCGWHEDLLKRPTFSVIRQKIDSIITSNSMGFKHPSQDLLSQSHYVSPSRLK